MSNQRTCFVISRIGEEGSPARQKADDVFELVVQPALEKFGMKVIRADHISGTGSITRDVIRHVQESDLCIIDLSGENPNVYYECGRRHETGRPFIQIIERDEKIPFDIFDIRTIKYQLDDAREVRSAVLKIQSFVEEAMSQGFVTTTGATTMSSILEAINRIERRLATMETVPSGASRPLAGDFRSLTDNPINTFHEAYMRGDVGTIVALLPRLEALMAPGNFVVAAGVLALQGEEVGAAAIRRTLATKNDKLDASELKSAITALVQYHIARSSELVGVDDIRPAVEAGLAKPELDRQDRAYLHNQLGMIYNGAGKVQEALEQTEQAIQNNPSEPAYRFNVSIIYEKLGLISKAVESAQECLRLSKEPNPVHMAHAIEIFEKANLQDEAQQVLSRLGQIDPARAAFLRRHAIRRRE